MFKILIIEDDETISKTVKDHLSKWGYETYIISDFKNVIEEFSQINPHLILMDIGLPFFNGYHWCTQIRNVSNVPVIFMSSMSDNMNIVMAMNMGADDFVIKPFDLNVLTAKVQALLRRTYSFTEKTNIIEHKGVIMNLNDQTFCYDNNKIELTKNEFKILKCLFENAGKVVSRDKIIESLWEDENFIDDNTLTVNVTRIRKKLDEAGINDFIKTKKGVGYIVE